jgi:replicative DNA helicase
MAPTFNRISWEAGDDVTDAPSHVPPQSLEAEEAILGAMLLSVSAVEIATDLGLRAVDFYRLSYRTIFRVILEIADRDVVDELTVITELKQQNVLGEVGGSAAVMTLLERVPAVANARAYAQEVIDQAKLRRLVETGHGIAKLGYEHPAEPDALVAMAGSMVDDMSGDHRTADGGEWTTLAAEFSTLSDVLQERRAAGDAVRGISTGLEALDRRIGGLQDARLYIWAARPGMGKSALLSGVMEHIAIELGEHVAVFNFEMNPEQQAARAAARLGTASLHRMTNALPTEADIEDVSNTSVRIFEKSPRMHINRRAVMTVGQIAQSARRLNRKLKRDTGKGLAAIGIDYLQLIDTPGTRAADRTGDVSFISRGLKLLAKDLGIPVIALSQLNRSCESRTPPVPILSDLRESGAIEQDADVVTFLYRPEYYFKDETPLEWQGKAQAITAKWRDGVPGTDILGWDGPRTKFVHARDGRRAPFVVGGTREEIA